MDLLLAAAACTGALTIVLVVGAVASGSARGARARLTGLTSTSEAPPFPPIPGARREDSMPTVTKWLGGRGITEKLYIELAAAGLPIRPSEFVGIIAGAVIVSQILVALTIKNTLGYALLAIVAAAIPVLVLRVLQQRRRAAFDAQIVDALVMIASSLRSGFSFLRAMQMVSREMPPPISREFERVINEMNVGRPMEDALRSVVARVKSYDFDLVVTAVVIQHQVGGNLADILETIAATIRERVRILGEIRALTAEGKMSGVILVLLPIGLGTLLTVINPGYMSVLTKETIGHYLIGGAVAFQIIGTVIIRKMLTVDI
ncbi:MAG TPA: type II secretion system F family protein [Armatimonadota bacterium]|nr:type II secretion system F family protein [Armatimonadota bacterium]